MSEDNLKRRTIQGILWSAAESWGRQAISLIIFALLARLLGVEAFGLVSLAAVVTSFLQIFVDPGFTTAIIQRQEIDKFHLDTAFWTNIFASVMLGIFCFLYAGSFAEHFGQNELKPIIQWLSISFLFTGFSSVQIALAIRNLHFKSLAIRSLLAIVSGGLVGIIMSFAGFGVWSLIGKQLAEGLIGVVALWKISSWRPRFNISVPKFRELFSFGVNIFATNIFEYFNRQSDNLLVGYFLGTTALGYYTVAYQILMVMTGLLTSVVNQVAVPIFSKIQQEPERLKAAFYRASKLSSIVAFPIFAVVAVLSNELIDIIFGKTWVNSVPVLQVLTIVGTLHTISFLYSAVIVAKGKPFWRLLLNFFNAITNVFSFLIAVHWGIIAVAGAFVAQSILFSTPMFFVATQKLIGIDTKTYIKNLIPAIMSTTIMTIIIVSGKFIVTHNAIPKVLLNPYILTSSFSLFAAIIYFLIIRLIEPDLIQDLIFFCLNKGQVKLQSQE